jgi:hypothetical protein
MEKIKMTQKQIFVGKLLITYEKGATCYQLIKDYAKELKDNGISIDKINSVNATLASLASKELATKTKVAYNDKMVTNYLATQSLIDLVKESN